MDSYAQHDIEHYQLFSEGSFATATKNFPPWQARLGNNPNEKTGVEVHFWMGSVNPNQYYEVEYSFVYL